MRINRIELYNIGSYEGYNEFNIVEQGRNGNIVLVGGKNGAGKTTLFSSIKLCLYGYREAGYQALNAFYKKGIKKLINDKAKVENDATAYVCLDIGILNGQEWDSYILKRTWSLKSDEEFETFEVIKNNIQMTADDIVDFENYLLNLIPPELFELYFFDGEQIADFFLEDASNERVKSAFLTICGYDTFDIIYKNFKRVSKTVKEESDALGKYFEAEDALAICEKALIQCIKALATVEEEIELTETHLRALDSKYKQAGGMSADEWNSKLAEIKREESLREEINAKLKVLANEAIPYIILASEIEILLKKIEDEQELEKQALLAESITELIPRILEDIRISSKALPDEFKAEFLTQMQTQLGESNADGMILNLSKNEYKELVRTIIKVQQIKGDEIVALRKEIKDSIVRSQKIRELLESSNMDGVEKYLIEKEESLNKKQELIAEKERLLLEKKEKEDSVEKGKVLYKAAEKELEKQMKNDSVASLTAKAILFLDTLQARLFESEILKVQELFMKKMNELMRKEKFIDRICIDNDFNVHVYKKVRIDCKKVCKTIEVLSQEKYIEEYGQVHCQDLLEESKCSNLEEFLRKYRNSKEIMNILFEFDKSTMSKGEKQVFIMSLYWSMMQLCNKEVPFIIDTPFARIDTEHRAHITEKFFKELRGQVFIFSTDEEITSSHVEVIGSKLEAKFLIENTDNSKTTIKNNAYFGV